MRIAVGSDHAGLSLKELLAEPRTNSGHPVVDHATFSDEAVDSPDFGAVVGRGREAIDNVFATGFEGRHARRIDKITKLEEDA